MYIIEKTTSPEAIDINISSWEGFSLNPRTQCFLTLTDTGFKINFRVYEKNPKRDYTTHFSPVHTDSCVEWFVNFAPDICDHYFNFETNASGAMNVAFRRDRYDFIDLTADDVNSFNITPRIFVDYWETSYEIPYDFIKKYIPGFELKNGNIIKTNFYKCGDETADIHYLSHFPVHHPEPDFHRPEHFGEMQIKL